MSIDAAIIAALEAHSGRAHQLTVMATLHEYSHGSIETALSRMTRAGTIVRVSRGVYELPKGEVQEAPPAKVEKAPWLADGLAPFQRVRLFVDANPAPKKHAVLNMLARFVDGSVRAFGAMVVEGSLYVRDDGRVALGRNPKMPAVPRRHDPARGPKPLLPHIPKASEAEEAREAETSATPEVPQAARAAVSVADVPGESAVSESPAPVIEPAQATEQPEEEPVKLHAVPNTVADVVLPSPTPEGKNANDEVRREEFGGGGGGVQYEPAVMFSMHTDELCIDIDGDDDRALSVIRAVLGALKTDAE